MIIKLIGTFGHQNLVIKRTEIFFNWLIPEKLILQKFLLKEFKYQLSFLKLTVDNSYRSLVLIFLL